ncbi:hypothetical protein NKW46_13545 [Acetobacter indonesiensis]|nr:hypothetical protein [Acetobacter indonesiensis]MCP1232094.1 hypothetical protein [Acetobacter indonesiensis]
MVESSFFDGLAEILVLQPKPAFNGKIHNPRLELIGPGNFDLIPSAGSQL